MREGVPIGGDKKEGGRRGRKRSEEGHLAGEERAEGESSCMRVETRSSMSFMNMFSASSVSSELLVLSEF